MERKGERQGHEHAQPDPEEAGLGEVGPHELAERVDGVVADDVSVDALSKDAVGRDGDDQEDDGADEQGAGRQALRLALPHGPRVLHLFTDSAEATSKGVVGGQEGGL